MDGLTGSVGSVKGLQDSNRTDKQVCTTERTISLRCLQLLFPPLALLPQSTSYSDVCLVESSLPCTLESVLSQFELVQMLAAHTSHLAEGLE